MPTIDNHTPTASVGAARKPGRSSTSCRLIAASTQETDYPLMTVRQVASAQSRTRENGGQRRIDTLRGRAGSPTARCRLVRGADGGGGRMPAWLPGGDRARWRSAAARERRSFSMASRKLACGNDTLCAGFAERLARLSAADDAGREHWRIISAAGDRRFRLARGIVTSIRPSAELDRHAARP